jgi:hypothetical protein
MALHRMHCEIKGSAASLPPSARITDEELAALKFE